MEKVRGKRITSYCIFVILVLLVLFVCIPSEWIWRTDEGNGGIRIKHGNTGRLPENDMENQSGVSFNECRIFGIKKLIDEYYDAYASDDDMEILKYIDTFGDMSQEDRNFAKENVEQYMNIRCYCMEGYIEDSYLVVSYGYAKYYGINTTAPVIGTFFVRMNSSGNYYICNSVVSNESSAYNEIMFGGKQVQELREMAQYELDAACEVDAGLREFAERNKDYFTYVEE